MMINHAMETFGGWATSRLPALIAAVCLTAAAILLMANARRREAQAVERLRAAPGLAAAGLEGGRECREDRARVHGAMLDKLDQILSRLPEAR